MTKYKVKICLLGYQKHTYIIEKLIKHKSELFKITECEEIKRLTQCDADEWLYSDKRICQILTESNVDNSNVDLCLCFIENQIEDNYFTRDLKGFDTKTVLCSFCEVDLIFRANKVDIFNYIHGIVLNEIVQIATLRKVDEEYYLHDDTRGCLFDMCGRKEDIAIKYSKPQLCPECIAKIESFSVEKDFVLCLHKEFKSFKRRFFDKIVDFVKEKTFLSLVITILGSIVMNLISCGIYELIKYWFYHEN